MTGIGTPQKVQYLTRCKSHGRAPMQRPALRMLDIGNILTPDQASALEGSASPDNREHLLLPRCALVHQPSLPQLFDELRGVAAPIEPHVDYALLIASQERKDDPLACAQPSSHNCSVHNDNKYINHRKRTKAGWLCAGRRGSAPPFFFPPFLFFLPVGRQREGKKERAGSSGRREVP